MLKAYPQGRPQEDPRVPLPRYVKGQPLAPIAFADNCYDTPGGHIIIFIKIYVADFCRIEGVLVAKKDFNLPKHGDIDTKNLYVC